MHGENDHTVPYIGGTGPFELNFYSAPTSANLWADNNHCDSSPEVFLGLPGITRYRWCFVDPALDVPQKIRRREVSFYSLSAIGHTIFQDYDDVDILFAETFDFFARHQ